MIRGLEYADSKDTWTYEALPQCFPNQVCRKGEYLFVEGTHGGYEDRGIFIRRRIVAVGWDILAVSDTFSEMSQRRSCRASTSGRRSGCLRQWMGRQEQVKPAVLR